MTEGQPGKCNGLLKQCRECHYGYSAKDTAMGLEHCPECGEPRGRCSQAAGWGTNHPGEGRCKLHAGQSLRGPAHPSWVNGNDSAYAFLPAHYRKAVVAMLEQGDLVQLSEELAISRHRLRELMARLDADATPAVAIQNAKQLMAQLLGDVRDFQTAVQNEDTQAASKAMQHMEPRARQAIEQLSGALADYALWDEINSQLRVVTDVADRQRRIESDIEANVRADRLQALMEWVVLVIAAEVTDLEGGRQALNAIITQIRDRITGETGRGPGATTESRPRLAD